MPKRADERVQRLEGRTTTEQECLLVDDLLDAFMALPTEYLDYVAVPGPSGAPHIVLCLSRFHGQHCDASLCEHVQRCRSLTPLAITSRSRSPPPPTPSTPPAPPARRLASVPSRGSWLRLAVLATGVI